MTVSKLSFDEVEALLKQWESVAGHPLSEEERDECINALTTYSLSFEEWQQFLIDVKPNVEERYRKIMKLLRDNGLIDKMAYDTELITMNQFSPTTLTRRGKEWAAWLKSYKETTNI